MGIPLKKKTPKVSLPVPVPVVADSKKSVSVVADSKKSVVKVAKKATHPAPLNRQIPRKPSRLPVQDIPLLTNWKLMQMFQRPTLYIMGHDKTVQLWAPKVPVKDLQAHYKKFTPMPSDVVFTNSHEYWCPHCAEVKEFRYLACTDDRRCTGCGVPNYDKTVVEANYGEVD